MSLTEERCPVCDALVEENAKFCTNCGRSLAQDRMHTAQAAAQVLLEAACAQMHKNNFLAAEPLIWEALEKFPQYSDGYLIKLLCKLRLKNINELATVSTPLAEYEEFRLAQTYATNFQRERNDALLAENANYIEKKQQEDRKKTATLKREINELRSQIREQEKFLKENPLYPQRPTWRKVLRRIEKIIMIVMAAFWSLGTLIYPVLIIMDAPFVLRLIAIVKRDKRERARPQLVQQAEVQLENCKCRLEEKMAELEELSQKTA